MALLVMLKAMFKRYAIELRRYSFNTISMLASFYLFFLLIFVGARSFAGGNPGFGGTLAGIIVGFMIFYLCIYAYAEMSWVLVQEAQQGTLEQLSMSPLGFGSVLIGRLIAALSFRVLIMLLFLVLMMATTNRWLHVDLVTILPLMALTIASTQGIGFVMGGLALVFKQIQASLGLLQFVFVGLIAAPIDTFPFVKYLPISWGTHLIRTAMIDGSSIWKIPGPDLLFLVANAAFYFGAGFALFKLFEMRARNRGLLGHY